MRTTTRGLAAICLVSLFAAGAGSSGPASAQVSDQVVDFGAATAQAIPSEEEKLQQRVAALEARLLKLERRARAGNFGGRAGAIDVESLGPAPRLDDADGKFDSAASLQALQLQFGKLWKKVDELAVKLGGR